MGKDLLPCRERRTWVCVCLCLCMCTLELQCLQVNCNQGRRSKLRLG